MNTRSALLTAFLVLGFSGCVLQDCRSAENDALFIDEINIEMEIGETFTIRTFRTDDIDGTGTGADGTTPEPNAVYTSSNPDIASVVSGPDNTAIITAHRPGLANITAVADGRADRPIDDTALVTVLPNRSVGIVLTPKEWATEPGRTRRFVLTQLFTDGTSTEVTDGVAWDYDNVAVATVDGKGLVSAFMPGVSIITAKKETPEGEQVATSTVTVCDRLNEAQYSAVGVLRDSAQTNPANGVRVPIGDSGGLANGFGVGANDDGFVFEPSLGEPSGVRIHDSTFEGKLFVATVTTGDDPCLPFEDAIDFSVVVEIGGDFTVPLPADGSTYVFVVEGDSAGGGSFKIEAQPLNTDPELLVSPETSDVMVGDTVSLSAEVFRGVGSGLPANVYSTWSALDSSVATIPLDDGVVQGLAPGTTTIFADALGLTGAAEVNVCAAVPDRYPPTGTLFGSHDNNPVDGLRTTPANLGGLLGGPGASTHEDIFFLTTEVDTTIELRLTDATFAGNVTVAVTPQVSTNCQPVDQFIVYPLTILPAAPVAFVLRTGEVAAVIVEGGASPTDSYNFAMTRTSSTECLVDEDCAAGCCVNFSCALPALGGSCNPPMCPNPVQKAESWFANFVPNFGGTMCIYDDCDTVIHGSGGGTTMPGAANPAVSSISPIHMLLPQDFLTNQTDITITQLPFDATTCPATPSLTDLQYATTMPAVNASVGRPIILFGGAELDVVTGVVKDVCGPDRNLACPASMHPKLHVFYNECSANSADIKLRFINLSSRGDLTFSLNDPFNDANDTSVTVPYGQASPYITMAPSAAGFPAVQAPVEVKNSEGDVLHVRNSVGPSFPGPQSKILWTGTCGSIIFGRYGGGTDSSMYFVEDPLLCSAWNSTSATGQPALWPMCP